jgi:hypothetical protein
MVLGLAYEELSENMSFANGMAVHVAEDHGHCHPGGLEGDKAIGYGHYF